MEKRVQKQLIVGAAFVLIVGAIGYGFFDYFFVTEPTCFDKVQNGKEEGVDCGLLACGISCEPEIIPLKVQMQKLLKVREGDYDFVAQVYNPNSFFGASRVIYNLALNKNDGTILEKDGSFFILPGQTRFIIVSGIRSDASLTDTPINIREVNWQKLDKFESPEFQVIRKNYMVLNKNGTFSELEAVILNNSDFDFDKVEAGIVLWDDGNNIVAVNRTDIRTFLSRTERYFKVSWPVELSAVSRHDIEVLTNIFENSNFIKRYGTQERFQKYY